MAEERIHDEERLYRSVRATEILRDLAGQATRASSQAFSDRGQEISVDRALLRGQDPTAALKSPSDAVVELVAGEVRGIRSLVQRDEAGRETGLYTVDVRPDPLPVNAAHALIYADPRFASRSVFKRLQERLAMMAVFVLLPRDTEE